MSTAAEFDAARVKEYGQYRAKHTIFINEVRAFNEGDPVPASHVDDGVVDTSAVEKVSAPAADPQPPAPAAGTVKQKDV